jgi:metal-dependent hydrolase (beta-lactamase superfamily II)
MAVQLIPAGLLLGGGLFIHESPLWLMRNDKEEQVFKNLQYLRQLAPEHQCTCHCCLQRRWTLANLTQTYKKRCK